MLRSLLSLAQHELRMTIRERAGWAGIITACALAFADAAMRPLVPIVGGMRASMFGGPMVLAPLAIVFVAGAARRDEAVSAGDVIDSRPYPGHTLFLARLLGNCALVLVAYALVIACSLLPALILGGRFASPLTPIHAFARGAVPLLYIATLAYCAVVLSRNVLAAAVVAVYWLFVLLWADFLARIFDFSLTQNWPTYAMLALAAALCTMVIRRRLEGVVTGSGRSLLPVAAVLLLVAGVLDAYVRVSHSHDKPLRQDAFALQLAGQHIDSSPRAPGFWLPDQRGGNYRVSAADGDVMAIAFWSPHVPASTTVLDMLRDVSREFADAPVSCVAVCVANDHAVAAHVAPEGHYDFPMVTDPATHYAGRIEECGPVVEAYTVTDVPTIFVTDRARRVIVRIDVSAAPTTDQLKALVAQALTVPVPPL